MNTDIILGIMKIGIDISQVVYGTGVSIYTKELVKSLLKADRENEYLVFGGALRKKGELKSFASSLSGRYIARFFPIPPQLANVIWNKLHIVKIEKLIGRLDVYHSSDWAQAPSDAFKVTTIHDLAPFKFPRLTPKSIISTHTARLKWVVKEVDRVIVPSFSTKADLLELGIEERRIRVIYEAPGALFKPQSDLAINKVLKKYKIPGDYVLSVGIGGRKNTERIIKAFELVRPGKNLALVLVGRREGMKEDERGIRYVGQVADIELATLYSGAEALIYPSLYEGFGLPILQAFACGCPVVTSNISSMPEIAGDAALLVDPYSVESIQEGIKRALAGKKGLVKKAFNQVKNFSWEKTAIETLSVYREVA